MLIIIYVLILAVSITAEMELKTIGGKVAKIEDWPFLAFIIYSRNDGKTVPACGGSLLSSQTVLTAAHCLDDVTNNKKDLNKFEGIYVFMGSSNVYKSTLVRRGIDYTTHADYNLQDTAYDLGILLLDTPVTFSETVKKTVLWTIPLEYPKDETLYVAGWGSLLKEINADFSEKLRLLAYKLIPKNNCQQQLPDWKLDRGIICAGPKVKPSKFVFIGDSGGPLVTEDGFQVGIVSYKMAEDSSNGLTIFTDIAEYADWIEQTQKKMLTKLKCGK